MSELAADAKPRRELTRASMGIEAGLPLNTSDGGIEALRRDIQMLMDIEAIKQLKHAYFRCLDTANFVEMAEIFHEDVSVHFIGGNYEWKLQGRAAYLESIQKSFHREAVGHHNGHHPEIQILSETEATGIWYLADNMWMTNFKFFTTGTALYWDRYLKVGGKWVIRDTKYERIYEIVKGDEESPAFSSRYLGTYGTKL